MSFLCRSDKFTLTDTQLKTCDIIAKQICIKDQTKTSDDIDDVSSSLQKMCIQYPHLLKELRIVADMSEEEIQMIFPVAYERFEEVYLKNDATITRRNWIPFALIFFAFSFAVSEVIVEYILYGILSVIFIAAAIVCGIFAIIIFNTTIKPAKRKTSTDIMYDKAYEDADLVTIEQHPPMR